MEDTDCISDFTKYSHFSVFSRQNYWVKKADEGIQLCMPFLFSFNMSDLHVTEIKDQSRSVIIPFGVVGGRREHSTCV